MPSKNENEMMEFEMNLENLLVILVAALVLWVAWQMVQQMHAIQEDLTTRVWWDGEDEPPDYAIGDAGELAGWVLLDALDLG
jgi:hypothetical protein